MDQETRDKLQQLEVKIDAIYRSAEKTRKYFLAFLWISVAMVVLPLIMIAIIVPKVLSGLSGALGAI